MTSIEAATSGPWTREDGILRSPLLASLGLDAGFTTRLFGSMGDAITPLDEQRRNRATFARRLGYDDVVRVRQVHGEAVVHVGGPTSSPWPEADALWSEERGLLLGIVAADCVPVLIADPEGAIGVAHAGWQGTSLSVARALVRSMAAGGVQPSRLVAALGPSIGPCCYAIDAERAGLVMERLGPGNEDIVANGVMDLWSANARQLREEGIATVEVSGICTRCGGEDVWSYRGRTSDAAYGTCLAFIGRPEASERSKKRKSGSIPGSTRPMPGR